MSPTQFARLRGALRVMRVGPPAIALASCIGLSQAAPAWGQASPYPAKAVRLVVPQPAGGGYDTIARVIGSQLQTQWGQAVVVENRPGGNAIPGTDIVAKAAPDGYTALMGGIGPNAINPVLFTHLPYDSVRDFAPVILVAGSANLLVVNPALPARTVNELVRLLKAASAKPLSFGSNGTGSSTHLASEMFLGMAGAQAVHIPYKGSAPMVTALLGDQVELAFMTIVDILPHVKDGRVRALAIATQRRNPLLPDVPTIGEAGYPGGESTAWFGVLMPAGTPREIISKVNGDINRALQSADVRQRLTQNGTELIGGTPEQFGEFIQSEITRWSRVVSERGVRND